MARFLAWRLAATLFVLLGVAAAVFTLMNTLPGDPATMLVSHFGASAKDIAILREQLGLNDPFLVRFLRFLGGALHGDLGKSFQQNRPVARILIENTWPTVQLALVSVGLATVLGVFAGVAAAVRRGRWADFLTMLVSLVGISMPGFWLGLMLMLVFAVSSAGCPPSGGEGWSGMVLPALTLALPAAATVARLTRSSMLEVLGEDYLRSARAKGLPRARRHLPARPPERADLRHHVRGPPVRPAPGRQRRRGVALLPPGARAARRRRRLSRATFPSSRAGAS